MCVLKEVRFTVINNNLNVIVDDVVELTINTVESINTNIASSPLEFQNSIAGAVYSNDGIFMLDMDVILKVSKESLEKLMDVYFDLVTY